MKKTLAALAVLLLVLANAHAQKTVNELLPPVVPSGETIVAELEPFGFYGLSDGQDEFGAGLSLGFAIDGLIGLEAEYLWLSQTERHAAYLNGFIEIPLNDKLTLRPFIGGGAWALDSVEVTAQGGVEVIRSFGGVDLTLGARYMWFDQYEADNMIAFTAGLRWTF